MQGDGITCDVLGVLQICSVSEDTYLVAKFQLLVFHCSHLLPSILGQHAAQLAQFVVQVFAESPPTGTAHSNRYSVS